MMAIDVHIWMMLAGFVLCVVLFYAVLRALAAMFCWLGRGVSRIFTGGPGRDSAIGARGPVAVAGDRGDGRVCGDATCRKVNRAEARYCGQCGRPLDATSDDRRRS